jgi:hypothetical protein
MAQYTITKVADGDNVWGRIRLEHVILKPALSDYTPGGYFIQGIGGTTEATGNVGLDKVGYALPIGGQGGIVPVWSPSSPRLQMWEQGSSAGPLTEVAAGTDLSAYTFNLLLVGL